MTLVTWLLGSLFLVMIWLALQLRYMTETLKEDHAIGLPIYPATNNGTQYTGTVDMSKFNRIMFICQTAVVGGGGNAQFQVQQTNNSNGQTNANVTNAAATIGASSQCATIELRADQLTMRYVQCKQVINTNASAAGCMPMACETRQHPQASDDASVTERVVLANT